MASSAEYDNLSVPIFLGRLVIGLGHQASPFRMHFHPRLYACA